MKNWNNYSIIKNEDNKIVNGSKICKICLHYNEKMMYNNNVKD